MNVLQLIDEIRRQVPAEAPFGTRGKTSSAVMTPLGSHTVGAAARIDAQGRRREQFWCDGVRVELPVLLRLTCAESECPHAIEVRAQWQAFHRCGPAKPLPDPRAPQPLMSEIPVTIRQQQFTARPARFPCFTPCPHGAHPPMVIKKTGFDLFEEGACIGGGVVEADGVRQPRLPTLSAAEAYVLARHLETLAALAMVCESSRAKRGPGRQRG